MGQSIEIFGGYDTTVGLNLEVGVGEEVRGLNELYRWTHR